MQPQDPIRAARAGFEASFAEARYYERQTKDDAHLSLLLELLPRLPHGAVLDLGTGTGYLAFPLARRNPAVSVVGLDLVEEALDRSRQRAEAEGLPNLRFCSYDGLAFPFADGSFDAVAARYALHHFPDLSYTFREIRRVLRPGGALLISDPTPDPEDSARFVDRFMQKKPDGHVRFYTQSEYEQLAAQTGFCLKESRSTSIRFPRKEAERYAELLAATPAPILAKYQIALEKDEIWITESVLNLLFVKNG